jgi:hypothetical protein
MELTSTNSEAWLSIQCRLLGEIQFFIFIQINVKFVSVLKPYAMMTLRENEGEEAPCIRHQMEIRGQLHASTALPPTGGGGRVPLGRQSWPECSGEETLPLPGIEPWTSSP